MMMNLPLDIGTLHFVGIGGIGMSGIAEVLHNLGYRVQGSDLSANAQVKRLQGLGVTIFTGQAADNVADADVLVISSAIKPDNVEVKAAREKMIPVVRRAEMLAELMRLKSCVAIAGTHGKTTTTSLIAAMFDAAGFDPTVINGGIINAYDTNARLGEGQWMVVEADESDGTFIRLPSTIGVVTNIDPEHLDHYGDFDGLRAAFVRFVENIPFYGFAVLCTDHPEVQALAGKISDRKIVTYGTNPQADIRATNIRYQDGVAHFDVQISDRRSNETRLLADLTLPMPGDHNVLNATAAIAIAVQMELDEAAIRQGFATFTGVKRRFTKTGDVGGVTIIDDYAHHPVEIAAVLKAARQAYQGKVIAVVQPHRYTRLRDLFEGFCTCFNDADTVLVAPVYAAGEALIEGFDQQALVEGLQARGHKSVQLLPEQAALAGLVSAQTEAGDVVVLMGAGNITQWAASLPQEMAA